MTTTKRLSQLEEDMYGNEKRKIPGVINDLANLKRMMRFALAGIFVILSNLFGLWRVSDPIDLTELLSTPEPAAVEAAPSEEPLTQLDTEQKPAQDSQLQRPPASHPVIEVSPDLRDLISKYLLNPALLLGLP